MLYRRPGGSIIRRAGGGIAANVDCCCVECVACNSFTPEGGPRPDVTVTVSPLTDGPDPRSCTRCDEVSGTWDVPYDVADSDNNVCRYKLVLDPAPTPTDFDAWDTAHVPTWQSECSLSVIRVWVQHVIVAGVKKSIIMVRLTLDTEAGLDSMIVAQWDAEVVGWHGTFNVPPNTIVNVPGSAVCETADDAIVTIPCITAPP